jgi:hypothetical protein
MRIENAWILKKSGTLKFFAYAKISKMRSEFFHMEASISKNSLRIVDAHNGQRKKQEMVKGKQYKTN